MEQFSGVILSATPVVAGSWFEARLKTQGRKSTAVMSASSFLARRIVDAPVPQPISAIFSGRDRSRPASSIARFDSASPPGPCLKFDRCRSSKSCICNHPVFPPHSIRRISPSASSKASTGQKHSGRGRLFRRDVQPWGGSSGPARPIGRVWRPSRTPRPVAPHKWLRWYRCRHLA